MEGLLALEARRVYDWNLPFLGAFQKQFEGCEREGVEVWLRSGMDRPLKRLRANQNACPT
jgi:hypothetical protein